MVCHFTNFWGKITHTYRDRGQIPVRLSFPLSKTFAKAEWPTTSSRNLKDIKITTLEMEGREIAPNTSANATKFFTLATKSSKFVAKLAIRMFHHNLTYRYSELKRFAEINPRQTSSLSLFPKCSTCILIDN